LLVQARHDWTNKQITQSFSTGKKAEAVPSDAILIAYDPSLAQAIAELSSSTSSGATPMVGGGAPAGGGGTPPSQSASGTSQDNSTSSSYSASGAETAKNSEPQQVDIAV
jgi:hypothetical protein